jgi:hypothetical protein
MSFTTTAVTRAYFIRELFKEHFHNTIRVKKFTGAVEIDESLFGRRMKFNRGKPIGFEGVTSWFLYFSSNILLKLIIYFFISLA